MRRPVVLAILAATFMAGSEPANSRGGGFGGGGFGGGFHDDGGGFSAGGDRGDFDREPSSFGDGGFGDRGADAGFGGGGYGSVHPSDAISPRTPSTFTTNDPYARRSEATAQAVNAERADWNHYSQTWNNYYAGVAYDRGLAYGAAVAAVPAGAYALNYLGTNYWYASGYWYAEQANAYVVVPPVVGAVVPEPPPSCSAVGAPGATYVCGGVFFSAVDAGYKVVPPPIGATVASLPRGAVHKSINGATYYTHDGVWFRPAYRNGGVAYRIVKEPV
jgi:Family of unknown function (DUF6515)